MARIPEQKIERLKNEVSVERLVETSDTLLKKSGKDLLGRCPFHEDDTASLVVTPPKGGTGSGAAHRRLPPTISAFGCVGFGCLSGGMHDPAAQVSMELTLGGGIEICDGSPATPPPSGEPKQCKAGRIYDRDGNDVTRPPGFPVPRRAGGLFLGPSIKADGRFCLRIGPHVSVPGVPSVDLGNLGGN